VTLYLWDASVFWSAVEVRGGEDCWPWLAGRLSIGYGSLRRHGRAYLAHRRAYELTFGPIPSGLTIDHRCHNAATGCPGGVACLHRRCVNPSHLDAVPLAENIRRSGLHGAGAANAAKTHCRSGHALTVDNVMSTPDRRTCKACAKRRRDAHRQRTEVVRT